MQTSELNVRAAVGNGLAEQVQVQSNAVRSLRPDAGSPNGKHAILLLIHGYNVSLTAARHAYTGFLDALDREAEVALTIPVYQFMWPGDHPNGFVSALSYFQKIDVALDAGIRLADFLQSIHGPDGGPIDVHIVAHSLGNRVLLQMLDRIASSSSVIVRSATLMAAAVPVELVTYTRQFYNACRVPRRSLVLHSFCDWVLAGPFRLGETLHGGSCLPRAVGWLGGPTGSWSEEKAHNSFLHGHYWTRPGPPREVLGLLSFASARETPVGAISSRTTAEHRVGSSEYLGQS